MNNPLFAGNPQLQEQFRSQLPIFLQQVMSIVLERRSATERRALTKLGVSDNDRLVALSNFLSASADDFMPLPFFFFYLLFCKATHLASADLCWKHAARTCNFIL